MKRNRRGEDFDEFCGMGACPSQVIVKRASNVHIDIAVPISFLTL
jgi:hypothetical protein